MGAETALLQAPGLAVGLKGSSRWALWILSKKRHEDSCGWVIRSANRKAATGDSPVTSGSTEGSSLTQLTRIDGLRGKPSRPAGWRRDFFQQEVPAETPPPPTSLKSDLAACKFLSFPRLFFFFSILGKKKKKTSAISTITFNSLSLELLLYKDLKL